MEILIDVILRAGRSAVALSLFVLLPVMVVMLSLMRLLEARGVLDWLVARLAPLLRPLGLTGPVSYTHLFALLKKRYLKLVIPYLAAVLLSILCAALARRLMDHDSIPDPPGVWQVLSHIAMMQNLSLIHI